MYVAFLLNLSLSTSTVICTRVANLACPVCFHELVIQLFSGLPACVPIFVHQRWSPSTVPHIGGVEEGAQLPIGMPLAFFAFWLQCKKQGVGVTLFSECSAQTGHNIPLIMKNLTVTLFGEKQIPRPCSRHGVVTLMSLVAKVVRTPKPTGMGFFAAFSDVTARKTQDNIATDWASKEDWVREKEVKSTLVDKNRFATFALDSVELSAVYRKRQSEMKGKKEKEKTPRDLGHADTTIHTGEDGPAILLCGDSNVTCKMDQGTIFSGTEEELAKFKKKKKTLHSWWTRKIANPMSKIDDFVKHVFQEHNQEADLWTNSGAEGQRKIVVDKCNTSETWNAVKGCWDESFKDSGQKWMRCGDQRCRQEQMVKLHERTCSRESSIWSSTNVCVFRVSINASTKFSSSKGRVCRSVSRASEIQTNGQHSN